MSSPIITDSVTAEIAAFCRAFADRYCLQPPEFTLGFAEGVQAPCVAGGEFTDPRYALGPFADLYERDLRGVTHPLRSSWYERMIATATAADLDALTAAFDKTDSYANAFRIFLMGRLTNAAYRAFKAGLEVSAAFPDWLRAAGWNVPTDWVPAAAAAAELAVTHSAGTPPGSPPPPMWRTGSCGESGPFIGLSFPHSIALVKRMAADPDGHRNAFRLCAEVAAAPEPDVLRDFTVQEVIDGMAGSYSWDRAHTLDWLKELVLARPDPIQELLDALAGGL